MKRHTSIVVLLCAALLASCKLFDETGVRDISGSLATARIKFNNFASAPTGVTTPGVNFFANSAKMTAVATSACSPLPTVDSLKTKCQAAGIESATGVVYGGNASGGLYMGIAPGQSTLTAKKAATDTVISTVTQAIADGKYYSFFMSGIYDATTKTAEAFVLEDPIPAGAIDYTKAYVRFVNAVPNGTAAMTMYVTNTTTSTETALGGAVAYKTAGTFTAVPEGTYNAAARYTTTNITGLTRTTLSFLGGHAYTITARGSTATSATLSLDFTENQP